MTTAQRILRAVEGTPWAIQQEKLEALVEVVSHRLNGKPKLTAEEVSALSRDKPSSVRTGSIAVLPVFGVVAQRMDMMMEYSGGTSTERFAMQFREAVEDDTVSAIVLDVDSPGGAVSGVPQLADLIYKSRGKKPIIAVANSLMASAAYWIGSAADTIVAAPLSFVGSIGVFTVHVDVSEAEKMAGVKVTLISAGKFKVEANPHEPLSDEAQSAFQAIADEAYSAFTGAVAKHRGVKVKAVRDGYGQGRALIAPHALEADLVDRIGTLDQVVADLAAGKQPPRRRMSASSAIVIESGVLDVLDMVDAAAQIGVISSGMLLSAEPYVSHVMISETTTGTRADAPDEINPRNSEQAPTEARSETMAEPVTAAPQNGATATDPIVAERTRVVELRGLVKDSGGVVSDDVLNGWITQGTSYEVAAREVFRMQREKNAATPGIAAGTDRAHTRAFASFGEQLQAVIVAGGADIPGVNKTEAIGRLHEMQAAATGHSATVGSDGGFLVGRQHEQGLMKRAYDESVLAQRCARTPIGDNADGLEVNMIDEDSRATGSRYGGVRFYRVAEAESVAASKLGLKKFDLRLEDLMAVTYLTERLMQDAPALQAEIEQAFGLEGSFVLDDEIFRGSGAGQCLGFTKSAAWVEVAKETNQVAGTVLAMNILKIWARVWSRSRVRGVWLYNQALDSQLPAMNIAIKNVAGTENVGGFPIFIPAGGIAGQQHASLFGRPLLPIEQADAPGTPGDISFFDGSQYKLIDKGGTKIDESMHVRFLNNERALRFTYRVNGKPMWNKALTPYKGSDTLSPFVGIAVRA